MIHKIPKWILLGGGVLAFAAGMVNTIALMGFVHQGATHVTGNFSRLSIALYQGHNKEMQELFLILVFFLIGAILSGVMLRDPHLKLGQSYGWALALEACFLFGSAYMFHRNSVWGEYLASLAAGLQNALASNYSGAIIRTTHLTGILTDLGVLIGHFFHGVKSETRRFKLFLILIVSFTLGGILGTYAYGRFSSWAMLIPACIIAGTSVGYFFILKFKKLAAV